MILRWLDRSEWEALLRGIGAEPLIGITALNTAEWWRIPGKPPFTVPVEEDGRCDYWAMQRIREAQSAESRFWRPLDS